VAPYGDDALNLPVAYIESAAAYYERVFGFHVVSRQAAPHPAVVLARDDIEIGLAQSGGDLSNHIPVPVRLSTAIPSFVLVSTISACASLPHQDGLRAAHLERLYFGRNIGDTAVVSDSAWAGFVREIITPTFPEGATVWDAAGQWRAPDGALVRERSYVVELLHLVTPDVERRVRTVMDEYKHRFAQQSVLRMVTNVRASF
jgi:hypothetical protein